MISIFPLWTFHLYVTTFRQHLYIKYISLSWYSRACGSYQDFLNRGVVLTRKLLNLLEHTNLPPIEVEFVLLDVSLLCIFCRSLFFLLTFFRLAIISVLSFTDSDYPLGILKHFFGFIHFWKTDIHFSQLY
jgi:hypothetical protein